MNIVFLFSDNFPGSSAYANRIHSLAKGLSLYSNNVDVSVVYPGNHAVGNELAGLAGEYDSVKFKYYCGVKFKPKSRIKQIFIGLWGVLNFFVQHLLKSRNDVPDFIIACSSSLIHLTSLYLLGALRGVKILREYNEYPIFVQRNKNYFAKIARYKLLDGFIFMTHRLESYFKEELKMNQPSCIINMTVDMDRFAQESACTKTNTITLVGDILGEKDGVENLLRSFKLIHAKHPEITLLLVGNINDNELLEKRLSEVDKLGVSGFVEFTGLLNRDQIPTIMRNSKLLLLPRPTSLQSESGFPTKLGEYLASGTPVIVTKTGEIASFLSDQESAILVDPDNPILFAEKVIEVLNDLSSFSNIGIHGMQVAQRHFSYKTQAKLLSDFLNSFNE